MEKVYSLFFFIFIYLEPNIFINYSNLSRSCSELNTGQFKCSPVEIDEILQTAVNCSANHSVIVPCYPAPNVICEEKKFDGNTIGFLKEMSCRYVTKYHYQTAVLLSIFLGIFGIDRFYLGKI